ncbi:MAG: zinc ribbon domain-containing protein [Nevskiaceae bacterium]|nr:MAG: zinc ribbon domain-containing protein [Nevskiaceae bacterium]
MPIYEYHCRACGQASEILQKISEPDAKKCPLCGKSALTRQVSAAGFRLKGGGWYETDFKSGNKKNLVGDAADAGGDKPAAPTTAESKPAAKPKDKGKKKAAAAAK